MTFARPVAPRATRMALIVASVPLLTRRTFSTLGTASMMRSANSDSAFGWGSVTGAFGDGLGDGCNDFLLRVT